MLATKPMRALRTTKSWSERTDEELVLVYRDHGHRGAFDELVRRYERELYSYLRRYLGDAAAAEDAFQATFLQVHLKCDKFEPDRKVRPWLYTIATNQAIDLQRRGKRHRLVSLDRRDASADDDAGTLANLLESREPAPAAGLESDERERWVHGAVADLPEQLRTVVNLIYYQGLKYRDVAEMLNVPVGTVKSRMHTAVQKLNEAGQAAHLT
jgi:RNA polymerase sigma-70 factor, ECF subfamily